MKTYKFDVTNEASLPVEKNVIDKAVVDEKTADKEEQIEKKPKKKLPIFGIGAIAFSVVALGVSLFALLCASLPSILEFGYYAIGYLADSFFMDVLEYLGLDGEWLYDILEVIYYRGDYYDYYYYGLSHSQIAIMLINHWRDILLLVVSLVGALLSGASLIVNIKGKNHLATGVGAAALSISLVAVVSLASSIISYFGYDAIFVLNFFVDAIEGIF